MKKIIFIMTTVILTAGLYFQILAEQVTINPPDPPDPTDYTICRCKGPDNLCLGGNLISFRPRCGQSESNGDSITLCSDFQSNCGPA